MHVLIAPDKFKGSLTAGEVAEHLCVGLERSGVRCTTLPLADGGDGSVAAGLAAGMRARTTTVADALGSPRQTTFALGGGTAIVEVADSCGLATLPAGRLAPMTASSSGFGQAIRCAVADGARRVVLALGGSASTDGGTGMLAALGYTFYDRSGRTVVPGAGNLGDIDVVSADDAVDLSGVELVVANDVTNPLTGTSGAAVVFGPQKGAGAAEIDVLDSGLENLVAAVYRSGHHEARTWSQVPGAGAAGGCGFAALLLGARMACGADYFLDLLGFDELVRDADIVITGEGRLDDQTLAGKLPAAVAGRSLPRPVIAVVGRNDVTSTGGLFAEVHSVSDIAAADTSRDPVRTADTLRDIGARIGCHAALLALQ